MGLGKPTRANFPNSRQGVFFGKRFRTVDSFPETHTMAKSTYRIVTRATDGTIRIREYPSTDSLSESHQQIGIDDCSTDLSLRGLPVFRGLIGPIPEGKGIIRYESPEVFETLTKEWSSSKPVRRSRRRTLVEGALPNENVTST